MILPSSTAHFKQNESRPILIDGFASFPQWTQLGMIDGRTFYLGFGAEVATPSLSIDPENVVAVSASIVSDLVAPSERA
jgi:hypothetical protein